MAGNPQGQEKKDYTAILGAVKNPLIFFALALLIMESVLTIALVKSNLADILRFFIIIIMLLVFIFIVGIVAFITVKYPTHLYEQVAELSAFIDSKGFSDAVDTIIEEWVDPRAYAFSLG